MADLPNFNLTPQNMPTNSGQVTQLPYQTQYGLDQAGIKRQLAQVLLQKGLQQPQGQTIVTGANTPNVYVKPSIIQNAANIAQEVLGARMLGDSANDMRNVMQGYQDFHNAENKKLSDILDPAAAVAGSGTAVAQPVPGDLSSPIAQMRALYRQAATSYDPQTSAKKDEYLAKLNDLVRQQSINQTEQQNVRVKGAQEGASAESKVDAANTAGAAPLMPNPPLPGGGTTGIDLATGANILRNPSNGVPTLQESQAQKIAQTTAASTNSSLDKRSAALGDARNDVVQMGYIGNTAQAMMDIIKSGKAYTGAAAADRAELGRFSQLLGRPVSAGTTYHDILTSLGVSLVKQGQAAAGIQQLRSSSEFNQLLKLTGADWEKSPASYVPILDNLSALSNVAIRNHNTQVSEASRLAAELGRKDTNLISGYHVGPEDIASVQSGLPGTSSEAVLPPPAARTNLPQHRPRRTFNPDGTPVQ